MLSRLKQHAEKILIIPAASSLLQWGVNVFLAYANDGMIDDQEFHQLIQGTSTMQSVILIIVIVLLRLKSNAS